MKRNHVAAVPRLSCSIGFADERHVGFPMPAVHDDEERTVTYWWASQGRNYPIAIAQGSLWSSETSKGVRRGDRTGLFRMEVGDVVFHYYRSNVRAVSQVVATWVHAPRPDGYPKIRVDDLDEGWLVTVEPLVLGLELDWRRAAELVTVGEGGPFGSGGVPAQKYLSELRDADGLRLLDELDVLLTDGYAVGSKARAWQGRATDAEVLMRVRREQSQLRRHLLRGATTAACALCGRSLPRELLVAAHIIRRSVLDDADRRQFDEIAMLACTLGCDALFEWGFVTVDRLGLVRSGRATPTKAVTDAVNELVGRRCGAYSASTASSFADHARSHDSAS